MSAKTKMWANVLVFSSTLLMAACGTTGGAGGNAEIRGGNASYSSLSHSALKSLAERGDSRAALELGKTYALSGTGHLIDAREALRWLEKAWELGDTSEAELTALVAMRLASSPLGYQKAEFYLRHAVRQDPEDYQLVSLLGEAIAKSGRRGAEGESFPYFEQAANGGDTQAALRLASFYSEGRVVIRDRERALDWAMTAARSGDGRAMTVLTIMLGGRLYGAEEEADIMQKMYFSALHATARGFDRQVAVELELSEGGLRRIDPALIQEVESDARSWEPGTPFPWER